MQHAAAALALLVGVAGCRSSAARLPQPGASPAHASADGPSATEPARAEQPERAATSADAAAPPPATDTPCTRDEECAVATFDVSGPTMCCAACGTTPGTRRWYAGLRRQCAGRPLGNCPALACPMGPTRAVCVAGRCQSTSYYPDGGAALIVDRQRCLPEMACDSWTGGCALVSGSEQNGWYVDSADHAAPGDPVSTGRLCTTGGATGCEGVRVPPPAGVQCAPWTVPPLIAPATYRCVMDGARCVAR